MNWKRIGLVAGFIAVTVLFIWLIYAIFFAPLGVTPTPTPTPGEEVPGQLPTPGEFIPPTPTPTPSGVLPPAQVLPQKVSEARGGPVQTTELSPDRNEELRLANDGTSVVTYDRFDCKFYRHTPGQAPQEMTDQTFCGSDAFELAPQGDKAIIEFLDGSKISYDFTTKRQVTLPRHWEDFNFSPSGNEIAFKSMGDDLSNRWLAIANTDGSGGRQIESMGRKAGLYTVKWSPTNQIIATYNEGIDADRQRLYFVGQNGENFKSTVIQGSGIQSQWSSNGDRLLYSAYTSASGYRPQLSIIDASGENIGENRTDLGIATWAEKCTFADNTTLYCAVPRTLNEGAGLLPNSFDKGPDDLYRINLNTGAKVKLTSTDTDRAIEKIIVSSNQTYLYFTDKATGKLYKIDL